jgi:hypothetical protein
VENCLGHQEYSHPAKANELTREAFVSFLLSDCPRFSAKLLVLLAGKTETFCVVRVFFLLEAAAKFLLQNQMNCDKSSVAPGTEA